MIDSFYIQLIYSMFSRINIITPATISSALLHRLWLLRDQQLLRLRQRMVVAFGRRHLRLFAFIIHCHLLGQAGSPFDLPRRRLR